MKLLKNSILIFSLSFFLFLFVGYIFIFSNDESYKKCVIKTEYGDEFLAKEYDGGFLDKRYSEIYDKNSNYIATVYTRHDDLEKNDIIGICNESNFKAYKISHGENYILIYDDGDGFKEIDNSNAKEYPNIAEKFNNYLDEKEKLDISNSD